MARRPEMYRTRSIASIVALAAIAVIVVSTAAATTSPTNYKIFRVRLTDSGVAFTPKAKLEVGEVGLFRVTNTSKSNRVFSAGGRATHVLKKNGTEAFYEIFTAQGNVQWQSRPKGAGKSYKGFIVVAPCKDASGTSSCNGTGG